MCKICGAEVAAFLLREVFDGWTCSSPTVTARHHFVGRELSRAPWTWPFSPLQILLLTTQSFCTQQIASPQPWSFVVQPRRSTWYSPRHRRRRSKGGVPLPSALRLRLPREQPPPSQRPRSTFPFGRRWPSVAWPASSVPYQCFPST